MTDLAAICVEEFRSLQASAPRVVAAGRISRDEAEAKLRAWLAMAVLLGADAEAIVTTGRADLAEMRAGFSRWDSTAKAFIPYTPTAPELARAIADREAWSAELAREIDKAIAQAQHQRADRLLALARHFGTRATLAEPLHMAIAAAASAAFALIIAPALAGAFQNWPG